MSRAQNKIPALNAEDAEVAEERQKLKKSFERQNQRLEVTLALGLLLTPTSFSSFLVFLRVLCVLCGECPEKQIKSRAAPGFF